VQYVDAQRLRRLVTEGFLDALRGVDLLLTPTVPIPAPLQPGPPVATPNPLTRNTYPLDISGLPALSLPCGFDHAGLPAGLQLIGRPFEEAMVLRAGQAYQQATTWHTRRPPMAATPA
jgi:aspartyl-tRNA(Asn)/glutamyl-tRNA(Gln) amidotransferase subunit A